MAAGYFNGFYYFIGLSGFFAWFGTKKLIQNQLFIAMGCQSSVNLAHWYVNMEACSVICDA